MARHGPVETHSGIPGSTAIPHRPRPEDPGGCARRPQPFLDGPVVCSQPWLAEAAEKWSKDVRASVGAGRRLFGERFLAVRYEDFLHDPPGQSLAM
jgi:hypothetical protein